MGRRIMGSASFFELQDHTGRIQVYIRRDDICPEGDPTLYNTVFKKLLDIGDFVGVKGFAFITQTGELSVHCRELTVLGKSIRPLPVVKEKDGKVYDAFTDPDTRYRQRYVDLVVNPQVREVFAKRAKIIATMRRFFDERGYLEVETPILQPIPGGAAARPFITHHNTLDTDLYLRIANELYLKRLIVGGFNGVYEFAKDFRNEGMDRTHNPEFTVMEIYVTYKDYLWMMDFTEEMVEQVALAVNGTTELEIWGQQVRFRRPFPQNNDDGCHPREDRFRHYRQKRGGAARSVPPVACGNGRDNGQGKADRRPLRRILRTRPHSAHFRHGLPHRDVAAGETPPQQSRPDGTVRTLRGRQGLCNAYSELNDPIDQLGRFQEQLRLSEKGDDEAMFIDMDFVRALEYGMPPTSGMGMGIDRLTMFMTNQPSIQDVLLFPQMKPEKGVVRDNPEKYAEKGIPEEWVPVLHKMGFLTVDSLKKLSAGKLFNDLCGFNKKNKLGLKNPTAEEVKGWVE